MVQQHFDHYKWYHYGLVGLNISVVLIANVACFVVLPDKAIAVIIFAYLQLSLSLSKHPSLAYISPDSSTPWTNVVDQDKEGALSASFGSGTSENTDSRVLNEQESEDSTEEEKSEVSCKLIDSNHQKTGYQLGTGSLGSVLIMIYLY